VLAHDMRNYLAPIRGRLELLQRRATREGHASNVRDTTELRRAVDRFSQLISELLDVARIDQGLFEVTPEPMDLAALVREEAEAVALPGLLIQVQTDPEVRVVADPARVRQAVANLLANAVQHAPPGTTVSVSVAYEELKRQVCAVVVVSDQGAGIDPELLPRLFERFARSPKSVGLGIGLFLARQIAVAHGGNLEVTSSSSTGTRFKLFLPAERP